MKPAYPCDLRPPLSPGLGPQSGGDGGRALLIPIVLAPESSRKRPRLQKPGANGGRRRLLQARPPAPRSEDEKEALFRELIKGRERPRPGFVELVRRARRAG